MNGSCMFTCPITPFHFVMNKLNVAHRFRERAIDMKYPSRSMTKQILSRRDVYVLTAAVSDRGILFFSVFVSERHAEVICKSEQVAALISHSWYLVSKGLRLRWVADLYLLYKFRTTLSPRARPDVDSVDSVVLSIKLLL